MLGGSIPRMPSKSIIAWHLGYLNASSWHTWSCGAALWFAAWCSRQEKPSHLLQGGAAIPWGALKMLFHFPLRKIWAREAEGEWGCFPDMTPCICVGAVRFTACLRGEPHQLSVLSLFTRCCLLSRAESLPLACDNAFDKIGGSESQRNLMLPGHRGGHAYFMGMSMGVIH